jgi:threonine dehydrogenase-like Zn-dependent dehydrogenase
MKAAIFKGPGDIEVGERPDPAILEPTDAVVRVVLACVCGSDLWYYRGVTDFPADGPIGHEFIGVVEQVGDDVKTLSAGDFVVRLQRRNVSGLPGRNDHRLRARRLHSRRQWRRRSR